MLSHGFVVLAAAALASAVTPAGFTPASSTDLIVAYGNLAALNGAVVARDSTQVQPTLATAQRLTGTYAVLMVDLDIPTDAPPATNTLLHWMQTGLTSAETATTLTTTAGTRQAFLLQNRSSTAPLAPYFGPNPPARVPLSHRYTFVLVDHSRITPQGLQALQTAAATRLGFNAQTVLQQAGLASNVVAGNFYNVTNPGPAAAPGTNTTVPGPSGTRTPTGPTQPFQAAAVGMVPSGGVVVACLGLVGALFLGL